MRAGTCNIAHLCGLPEVHKEGIPPSSIISLPGAPTSILAKELWGCPKTLTGEPNHSIKCPTFFGQIKYVSLEEDEIMLSLDVAGQFTSFDSKMVDYHYRDSILETSTICELTNSYLCTYFKFDGDICEQMKGTPAGSPISGFLAKSMMQTLENTTKYSMTLLSLSAVPMSKKRIRESLTSSTGSDSPCWRKMTRNFLFWP